MGLRAIGLMSGTSCDGVDAILLDLEDLDRPHTPEVLAHIYRPFDRPLQARLREPESLRLCELSALGYQLAHHYAEAVQALPQWHRAEVCGMHGQTVWHQPRSQSAGRPPHTLQLGSSGVLAQALGIPVVADMRAADIALGGEGAPIAPIAHWMFTPAEHTGRLVVNIGGITNVTFVTPSRHDVIASDIGPGMMITDALARRASGGQLDYDHNAQLSTGGQVIDAMVEYGLSHPFFRRPPPRSTGREDFGSHYVNTLLDRFGTHQAADLLASSLELTAQVIVGAAIDQFSGVTELVLTGGGACHPGLRARVRDLAAPIPVVVHERGALAPQHHEPAAMALIAARTLHRRPSGLPRVTGARQAAILGHIHWPTLQ